MTRVVLGLDIGGANLKAATPDGRTKSVPFALWKQPDRLPAALAELMNDFPDATELAVTMTGELCDCYETKRQGVNAILDATEHAARGRPVRVWGTDGRFHSVAESRDKFLTVAAANWHALASFAARFLPTGDGLLIDIGSTTTDIIPIRGGRPATRGLTDPDRLANGELVYVGVKRTPLFSLLGLEAAGELFATTHDVFVVLGKLPEAPDDRDTADGRPMTKPFAHARLARMKCADAEMMKWDEVVGLAREVERRITERLATLFTDQRAEHMIISGAGQFLAREIAMKALPTSSASSLTDRLGPQVSECAPAYAVAQLKEPDA
jgi:probable H4MPT-linked C1 transfer pathway protein